MRWFSLRYDFKGFLSWGEKGGGSRKLKEVTNLKTVLMLKKTIKAQHTRKEYLLRNGRVGYKAVSKSEHRIFPGA